MPLQLRAYDTGSTSPGDTFDFLFQHHVPDRALLRYQTAVLNPDDLAVLEAHLLLCPTCQLQLEGLLPATSVNHPGLPGRGWLSLTAH